MRSVVQFAAAIILTTNCFSQAQVKSDPRVQENIINPESPVQLGKLGVTKGTGTRLGNFVFRNCDNNDVLLDVLNNIADPAFVKQEVDYETTNSLDQETIYNRRIGVIKALVGKK
jgi:hypothetical protein